MKRPNRIEMNRSRFSLFSKLLNLLFQRLCLLCQGLLKKHHKIICTACELNLPLAYGTWGLPETAFDDFIKNNALKGCYALFYFRKNESIEHLLFDLKYKRIKKIGRFFGGQLVAFVQANHLQFDGILGVPLHPKRKQKRGFNQVKIIGREAAMVLNIPYLDVLQRIKNTPPLSKTKKERKKVVQNAFRFQNTEPLKEGNYLMIDDIFTTGATLNACLKILPRGEKIHWTIVCIAYRN